MFTEIKPGEKLEHACITPVAPVGVEELAVEDRKQPGTQIAFQAFVGPADDRPFKRGLHQVVCAAGVAGQ